MNAGKQGTDDTLSTAEIGDRMTPEEPETTNAVHRSDMPFLKMESDTYVDRPFVEANTSVKPRNTVSTETLSGEEMSFLAGMKPIRLF